MKRSVISLTAVLTAIALSAALAVPVYAEDCEPVAENLELNTYRNVSVGGKLSAYDPDGDVTGFEITTQPVKGSIELKNDGSFVYTPHEDKRGRDYFGYKAMDAQGNVSQEATVIIRIDKQKSDVAYSDVDGTAGEYYAVALSESGVFTGERIGGVYCFCPERELSRGEFFSMCMLCTGEEPVKGVMSTGYDDDESIPDWLRPYAMTAVMSGLESSADGSFHADAPMSRTEAIRALNKLLRLNDVRYVSLDGAEDVETAQACANLSACGVICEGELISDSLTRIEAAELLVNAMKLIG